MAPRALVGLALLVVAVGPAEARVDPTRGGGILGPKPNILIVLDTSGSMSGVAGAAFGPASEVGMDCEHGENCRLGGVRGECLESKRACQSSQDCRNGLCSADSRSLCKQDSDCPQALGRCSRTGGSCGRDADCPQAKCQAKELAGRCERDGRTCESESDCVITMRCQRSGDLCREAADCPLLQTSARPANPCTGTPNRCQLPCPVNTCIMAPANTCQKPISASDTCVPATSGAPGPLRMCQGSHRLCSRDPDCGQDDLCGPATARAMIVKRALGRLVMDNHDLANFGLMTFYQDGTFPYAPTDAAHSETAPVFLAEAQLRRLGCYSWDPRTGTGGPSAVCGLDGRPAILRPTVDSRYRAAGDRGEIETDFCGESCELPHHRGLGVYLGSTYLVRRTVLPVESVPPLVRDLYEGHDISVGGRSYAYFTPRNDYVSLGARPPVGVATCRDSCSASCGGRWDARLAPFLDTMDSPDKAWDTARAISARLDDAAHGGLLSFGGTPTGCALNNDASPSPFSSVFHYMSAVKKGFRHSNLAVAPDPVGCRRNFVLLLTDGMPNGPGDVDEAGHSLCAVPACAADDPVAAGCRCRSALAAYRMQRELGVTVLVLGFSVDAVHGEAASANHNMAKAGGSGRALLVSEPHELAQALQRVLGQVAGGGEILPLALPSADGKRILAARTELPGWQGHVSAFTSGQPPSLLWDARAKLAAEGAWMQRRIYTWTGTKLLKILVDETTGAIGNKNELAAAGFGANAEEAEDVARWLLGDPAAGNPSVLGANLTSQPVEVRAPMDSSLPGGHAHFLRHAKRPALVYVGASDQMVHALLAQDTDVRGARLAAGREFFAFIPPDLLPRVRQLRLHGGQAPNPSRHVFGVSGSPRVLDLCVSGCIDEKTALWKTLLVVSEGPGGPHAFALDITDPLAGQDAPFGVAWHTGYGTAGRAPSPLWKDSVAAPSLLWSPTPELDDYQLVSASGFGLGPQQRANVSAVRARDGSVAWSKPLSPTIACVQEYAVVSEVSVAHAGPHDEQTVAGYFGDTAGQLWRITPAGGLGLLADLTCDHPLHFSPTVVQHVGTPGTSGEERNIYLVQVTNSLRDPATARWPASQMVFFKQVIDRDKRGHVTGSHADTQWGQGGRVALNMQGRPMEKPVAWAFGRGFRVATLWQAPANTVCEPALTTLTVHQVEADKVTQVLRIPLKSRNPAPSPVVRNGRLFVFDASGTFEEIAAQ